MSSGRFLGGLLIGGALGAIIGLLVAPRSGEETRDLIRDEFSDRVNHGMDNVKYRTAELRDRARDTAEQLRERGQTVAGELEDAGREAWEKVRTTLPIGKRSEETTH